jgi:glycosyltransferase involved in cell wall biosynthesis
MNSTLRETRFGPELSEKPVVSVLMITYNHERFIRQAIESVFMQECEFPIELVIGEDCSSDGTRAVIELTCRHAPIPVRLLTDEHNVGMHENFRRTLRGCQGEFVGLLEGDDFWTDANKLSTQTLRLSTNGTYSCAYHMAQSVNGDGFGLGKPPWPALAAAATELSSLIGRIEIPTASLVFRRSLLKDLPEWVNELPWCDWAIYLLLFSKGPACFVSTPMSAYRVHDGGISHTIDGKKFQVGAARTYLLALVGIPPHERARCLAAAIEHLKRLGEVLGGESRCLVCSKEFSLAFRRLVFVPKYAKALSVAYLRCAYPRLTRLLLEIKKSF